MTRRYFFSGIGMFSLFSLIPSGLPMVLGSSSGILVGTPHLDYLHSFLDFRAINKILKLYGDFPLSLTQGSDTEPDAIKIASLNQTYGRWSNFDFNTFHSEVKKNPSLMDQLFIRTTGPDGKNLSKKTSLKIISKNPTTASGLYLINDALPHAFNFFFQNEIADKKSYFIDQSSREKIQLFIRIPKNITIKINDLIKIEVLANNLQKALIESETQFKNTISKKYPTYDFSQLMQLEPKILA